MTSPQFASPMTVFGTAVGIALTVGAVAMAATMPYPLFSLAMGCTIKTILPVGLFAISAAVAPYEPVLAFMTGVIGLVGAVQAVHIIAAVAACPVIWPAVTCVAMGITGIGALVTAAMFAPNRRTFDFGGFWRPEGPAFAGPGQRFAY